MLKHFFCLVFFLSIISCQKNPHFSTSQDKKFETFKPIDISNSSNNKTEIIYLHDNKTQIYELENGEIYIKRLDPISNKEFMINLDNIESEMKFSENNNEETTSSLVSQNYSVLEWTPLIGKKAYPHKRRGHSSIVLDNYIIYFGGCYLDYECYNDVYFFDMDTNEWSTPKIQGTAPFEREGHIAIHYGSKMYIFGGSSMKGFLNDLFELDLINLIWKELNFDGVSPKGIANHQAVIDNSGKIIVFGGYNDEGYSNEVYYIDLVNRRWLKPLISGQLPVGKEHFTMTYIRGKIWVFGGYTTGEVLNELNVLDLDTLYWIKISTSGNKPSPRQGHAAVKQGKELYIIGGCNYKLRVCYKETYLLNTETLFWTKLVDDSQTVFTERDGHTLNSIGKLIVLFGGCKLMDSCSNDIMVLNTDNACPSNCSNNGVCRNERCLCYQGFQENDCSIEIKCHLSCSNHGKCQSNGKCACYPGYAGQECELFVPCPSNCTSESNGICKADTTCSCYEGFGGDACEISKQNKSQSSTSAGLNESAGCKNNCYNHGRCNDILGVCICENGYFGNSCQNKMEDLSNLTNNSNSSLSKNGSLNNSSNTSKNINEKNETNNGTIANINHTNSSNTTTKNLAQKGSNSGLTSIKQNMTNETNITTNNNSNNSGNTKQNSTNLTNESKNQTNGTNATNETHGANGTIPTNGSNESNIVYGTNGTNETNGTNGTNETNGTNGTNNNTLLNETIKIEYTPEGNRSLTARMFGLSENRIKINQTSQSNTTTYSNANCENACSSNGLCKNNICYCRPGFTGSDCSFTKIGDLQKGEKVGNFLIFIGASLLFGFVVGCLLLWYLGRKTQKEELRGIKEEEEPMDNEEND